MQSAFIPNQSVVFPRQEPEVAELTRHDSGLWSVRETELDGAELAAAILLAVHRGVVRPAARRMLPVRA